MAKPNAVESILEWAQGLEKAVELEKKCSSLEKACKEASDRLSLLRREEKESSDRCSLEKAEAARLTDAARAAASVVRKEADTYAQEKLAETERTCERRERKAREECEKADHRAAVLGNECRQLEALKVDLQAECDKVSAEIAALKAKLA